MDLQYTIKSIYTSYTILIQYFRVVYREISHELLDFSLYTHEPLSECVYK